MLLPRDHLQLEGKLALRMVCITARLHPLWRAEKLTFDWFVSGYDFTRRGGPEKLPFYECLVSAAPQTVENTLGF